MIGDKKLISLCTSRIYDSQVHGFIESFSEEIRARDMRLCVFSINMDIYWEEESVTADTSVFDYIPFEKTDVIVIMDEKIKSHTVADKIIRSAKEHDIPVIVIDGSYEGCFSIRFDFKKGFENVVRHLFEEHHITRPHFMAGIRDNVFSDERIEVFREILKEKGIPYDDSMLSYGAFWAEPARAATRELLKRDELPDAIICANDIMAINVCDVIKEAGIEVPDQILISGFDGIDEAFLASPGITTAGCDLSEMGVTAAKTTELCLNGEEPKEIIVSPELIPNESCGCPRCKDRIKAAMSRFNDGFYRYQDDIRTMHNSITRMMSAHSGQEAGGFIPEEYISHASCIVNMNCLKVEIYYFLTDDVPPEYCLLHDPLIKEKEPVPFDTKELIPFMEERLSSGFPLLIQSLDYMDKPMGYICYFFDGYNVTDYAKTANITEMVSLGLGGYITMKYQRYLLAKVEEMYKLDALTGLYNRLAFQEAFDAMKSAPENKGKPLLVVMADLDRLKKINDTLGHGAGDQAIAAVASALKEACPKDALCVRFGGDEMLAFIPNESEADGITEHIEEYLKEASQKNGFRISASCGCLVAAIEEDISAEKLISQVDAEMYNIKRITHQT